MFKRVAGTKDILPEEISLWQKIEEISRYIFSAYNYREIRPPLIEDAGLFNRSLGEFTEIVQKQMFLIKKDPDIYALRPEGTASIVRAYIENSFDKTNKFAKFYYTGAMFRLERPQKGRLRQFHHIGAEVIGSSEPFIDVEVISLADTLLKSYLIKDYTIKLNSLGCLNDKKQLTVILRQRLKDKINQLCDDCKTRFENNVLRVLDCKNDGCKKIVSELAIKNEHLCKDCAGHFEKVKLGLNSLNIDYKIDHLLVRGLDYYTGTVFEIAHNGLGAQDALGAGGRYNNLVKELGGPDCGAIGFAFGVERLLLVSGLPPQAKNENLIYIITLCEEARITGLKLLDNLRKNGIPADTDYENRSLKAAMRCANDLSAKYVIIIGEDELKNKSVMLKNMAQSTQEEVNFDDIIKHIKNRQ